MEGFIFEIKRFAVHDGDGIRTTVFFKGCPLKCVWCHNPEGIDSGAALAYYRHKCVCCGDCAAACNYGAHGINEGEHVFNRSQCVKCGKCVTACNYGALELYGKSVSVDDIISVVLQDKAYFIESGGGVTLSGGECLVQADFCLELLKALKKEGIHTAVDTCGFVSKNAIDKVADYTDLFLYDVKAIDENVHIKCTGQSNGIILENLKYIDNIGKKIEVRIPFVPNYNDGEMEKIGTFLKEIKNLEKIRVLPYHDYAASKYGALDMKNTLPDTVPTREALDRAREILKEKTAKQVF